MEVAFCVRHLFLALLMEFLQRCVRFMSAGSICTRLLVLMPLYKFWSKSDRAKVRPPLRLPFLTLQSQSNVKNIWRFTWSLITYLHSRSTPLSVNLSILQSTPGNYTTRQRKKARANGARRRGSENQGALCGKRQIFRKINNLLTWRLSWVMTGVLKVSMLLLLL